MLVGWRPLLVGWRPSLVGWRPSLVVVVFFDSPFLISAVLTPLAASSEVSSQDAEITTVS